MLDRPHRLTSGQDFSTAVRRGRRAGSSAVVVHLVVHDDSRRPPRAGFVVGRSVGGAVVRNRVRRRLRHLVRDRLSRLPAGADLVVRALPPAADSSTAALSRDLDSTMARILSRTRQS